MLYFLICRHWYNRSKYGNVSHSNCQRQRREQYQCLPVFIGHDLPAVPAQVTLVATDADDTHLTWTVPTAGTNGGMDRRGVARIRHYPAACLTALCYVGRRLQRYGIHGHNYRKPGCVFLPSSMSDWMPYCYTIPTNALYAVINIKFAG